LWAGCGGPTTPPAEQYFNDVKKNLTALDYDAATKNLEKLVSLGEEQPLAQQGVILETALLTAMAEGTKQMGDAYRDGYREPAAAAYKPQFTKMKTDYYGICRVRFMNAMENVMKQRAKLGEKPMPLDVSFPDFSGQDHPAIASVQGGHLPNDRDRYRAELESVRNSLGRTMARIVGAGEDLAKGQAVFEKGGVQVDPRVYLIEMSNTFMHLSDVFDRRALDDQRYKRISLEVVRDNLDRALALLEAKPDKELEARAKELRAEVEKTLKELP